MALQLDWLGDIKHTSELSQALNFSRKKKGLGKMRVKVVNDVLQSSATYLSTPAEEQLGNG